MPTPGTGLPIGTSTGTPTATIGVTETSTTAATVTTTTAVTATSTGVAAPATPTDTVAPTSTGGVTVTATPNTGPVQEPTSPRHYVVMIVIDAAKTAYFDLAQLPHIHALMKNGVVYDHAWVGEMESSTPGVHVTFGTGTMPKENGFLGFGWATPDTRKWVDFRTLLTNGGIDPVLQALPLPSIAARLHQSLPKAVSIVGSGHKDYAAVGLGGGSADYELYGKFNGHHFVPAFLHAPPPLTAAERDSLTVTAPLPVSSEDAWAFRYAALSARHLRPHLLMLNLPEMDTYGHWDGPGNHEVFRKLMKGIDHGIGLLEKTYQDLGILDRTDFIITADHAMMESRPARNWKALQDAMVAAGARVARADGTGGAIWLEDPSQAKMVADKLVAMKPNHVEAIFYRSQAGLSYRFIQASPMGWLARPAVGTALQHLVDTTAGLHGPDLWVLYRESYTVLSTNVTGPWKGTHGGATWKVQHVPLIISGPGIKKGVHTQFPARAIDIAPTIERLLGLPAIKRDGVILTDALMAPLPGEADPQRAIAPTLKADVQALELQSNVDQGQIWPALPSPIYRCSKPDPHCATASKSPTNH